VTVPRKGYRLIASVQLAPVTVHTPQVPVMLRRTAAPRRTWVVAGAFVALALAAAYFIGDRVWLSKHITVKGEMAADKSIAVLPFADMSEKMDQEYFSDGLAEELIVQLANTPGLKVIARTSSFSFKGKSDDIPTIASKLNVANLLEGSVRRSGNHLRVSTQLIRADSGQRLWSETFDREFKDVFTIQDEIAAAVVMALKVQLNGGSTAARGHGTTNPEAYNAYLLGRQLYTQRTIPTWRQAIEAYQKAIDLDPRYADAYADLAMSQYFLADNTGDVALGQLAEQAAQKSIDLDPHQSSGYSVRGFLRYLHHYDWVGAESDFRQALALEPTNSRVLSRYGKLLTDLGRTQEATVMLRKAIEQDPLYPANWQNLGIALAESRDHAAAYDAFHHALVIRPGEPFTTFALGTLQLIDGKAQEALATFQSNSMEEFRGAGVAMAEHTLGDAKASQQALDKLIATSAGDAAYQIAEVYGWRGEKDKAFEWLEKAYRQQDGGITDIKNDLRLASLRSDPRYVAMLRRLNFPP
jgi:TolB-like protein/Tfp pilus assembly protein PilF